MGKPFLQIRMPVGKGRLSIYLIFTALLTLKHAVASELVHDKEGVHLSWLLVGVWHEAAHKVGLAVVKSRLRKDARARFRHKEVFGQSAKY